jgi:hypothetical protein
MEIDADGTNNPHHISVINALVYGAAGKGAGGATSFLLRSTSAAHIGGNRFANLKVTGGGITDFNHTFYIQSSDNILENLDISDFSGAAIQVYNGNGGSSQRNIIRGNKIHDARSGMPSGSRHWAIVPYGGNVIGTQIYNNLIYNIPTNGGGTTGIEVGGNPSNTSAWNNTITKVAGYAITFSGTGNVAVNNITFGNSNNVISGPVTKDHNLEGVDPKFVDPMSNNYQLQETSPAIDTGNTIAAFSTDITGILRPQGMAWDIGSYEFPVVAPPLPGCTCTCNCAVVPGVSK